MVGQFKRLWASHRLLLVILVVSFGLRAVLIFGGGQFFFPDEERYLEAISFKSALVRLNLSAVLGGLQDPATAGVHVLGVLPSAVQGVVSGALGLPYVALESALDTAWAAALVLSLASVANVGLVYAVARRAGAARVEGLWAAFFMAAANTRFYYARHLLPYDGAMMAALLALWVGLRAPAGLRRSAGVGLLCGLAFFLYTGCWVLAAAVLALHVGWVSRSPADAVRRVLAAGVGPGLALAGLVLAAATQGRRSFVENMLLFSNTINHGDFAEGWRLVWAYLWHAEHLMLVVWLAGTGAVVWLALRRGAHRRGVYWVGGAFAVYGVLVLVSGGLHKFVVYGRLARQMVPFFCLASAYALYRLRGAFWPRLAAAGVLGIAAANFLPAYRLQFPHDVRRAVRAEYGRVAEDVLLECCAWRFDPTADAPSRYILFNAVYFYGDFKAGRTLPPGEVVFRAAHPLQAFTPYQYEGLGPAQRARLASVDMAMYLVDRD